MEFNPDLVAPCGMDRFLQEQETKYKCPTYGGVTCIHDGICYDCYVKQHPA